MRRRTGTKADGPVRQCVTCRRRRSAADLARFVLGLEGELLLDLRKKAPGRGASVCWSRACMEGAAGGLSRSLKSQVDGQRIHSLVECALARRTVEQLGLGRRMGQVQGGADVTERLARKGWACALALSRDCGGATRRRFVHLGQELDLPVLDLLLSSDEVGEAMGCPARSVLAVAAGQGLGASLFQTLQHSNNSL